MSAGCIRCGDCCDPVQYNVPSLEARLMLAYDDTQRDSTNPAWVDYYANIDWILGHWHDNGDATATCDAFDPETRTCTAHDRRPPVCSDFPWYGEEPGRSAAKLGFGFKRCSYQADLPPGMRPPDWEPVYLAVGKNLG